MKNVKVGVVIECTCNVTCKISTLLTKKKKSAFPAKMILLEKLLGGYSGSDFIFSKKQTVSIYKSSGGCIGSGFIFSKIKKAVKQKR